MLTAGVPTLAAHLIIARQQQPPGPYKTPLLATAPGEVLDEVLAHAARSVEKEIDADAGVLRRELERVPGSSSRGPERVGRAGTLRAVLLYDSRVSGNCYKVRLLFAHLGIDFERRELSVVDRSDRLQLLGALNPGLRVPTLVLDDGRALAESDAIMWFFAEGTQYLPEESFERAQVLQWMFFEQYSHEPNIAVLRFWSEYANVAPSDADVEAKLKGGYAALDAMERHLATHTFFVGERYTIADIALYAYTHVAEEGRFELSRYAHVKSWLERVAAQPGHVQIDA